jgi:hypothetical protein
LTFLKEQIDNAKRLGYYGLETECLTLVKYKTTYVDEVFGSNKCSYDSVTSIVETSNTCNKVAQEKWALAVDKLTAVKDKK